MSDVTGVTVRHGGHLLYMQYRGYANIKGMKKVCLFRKFCKRKGMGSEATLAHPCTKIREEPTSQRFSLASDLESSVESHRALMGISGVG